VISDLNSSYGSIEYHKQIPRVISHIAHLKPDLVISTGDMVAGQRLSPLLERPQLDAMWASFHENVSNPLARADIPFAVTAGNHDASLAKKFDLERETYRDQWLSRIPDVNFIDQTHYPFYYAFEVKDVLFIALDATVVGHLSTQQFAWLQSLLEEQEGEFRHRVAFSHLPIWPFAQNRERDIIGDPKLESLLQAHHVALYLSGHHHAFYPGFKDGITHVSQACLGSGLRKYIGSEQRASRGYTLIDIDANNKIHISAYYASNPEQAISFKNLPEKIKSRYAVLLREDIAAEAMNGKLN
jgi:3',5'-cyclic AMP phosphodiesterase CpdA